MVKVITSPTSSIPRSDPTINRSQTYELNSIEKDNTSSSETMKNIKGKDSGMVDTCDIVDDSYSDEEKEGNVYAIGSLANATPIAPSTTSEPLNFMVSCHLIYNPIQLLE